MSVPISRILLIASVLSPIPSTYAKAAGSAPRDIVRHVWHDQGLIATAPLRSDKIDRWVWGLTAASMLALMPSYGDRLSHDEHLASGIERENGQYSRLLRRVTLFGDGRVLFGASVVSYSAGAWMDRPALQRSSARWMEALIDTTIWTTAFKILAGRNRPESPSGQSRFTGPWGYFRDQGGNSSFPSGHTALAFTSAVVLSRETHWNPWVAVPSYVVAGTVGFSRVYVEKHWVTDALFGAALGHGIGMLVENRRASPTESSWRFTPTLAEEQAGFNVSYRW